MDATSIPRIVNDAGVFDGLYSTVLPETFAAGATIKLHVFSDNSIFDIFVNDTWACSIRLFPTDGDANDVEAFSEGNTTVQSLNAWNLTTKANSTDVKEISILQDKDVFYNDGTLHFKNISTQAKVAIYDLFGRLISEKKTVVLFKGQIYIVRIYDENQIITKKIITY